MKKVLFLIYIVATGVVILLHIQTIPMILLVILITIGMFSYYKNEKSKKMLVTSLIKDKDSATLQLKVASENNGNFLFNALGGIQKTIIKNEIEKSLKSNSTRIALPLFSEIRYVNINDIIRCEAENSYTKFFLNNNEEILVTKTLKEFADVLTAYQFVRTHQSHLVNTNFIKSWIREDGGYILLMDGNKIPISRANRDSVKEKITTQL
jgi:DNA-binding LytR/AlgR family response regulator